MYYRLNVVRIYFPPLRERREDIAPLASYFTSKYAGKCDRKIIGISTEARKCLVQYDWPGNVRELENAIERAVVIGTEEMLLSEDLPESVLEQNSPQTIIQYQELLKETKRKLLQQALAQASGNAKQAAHILGMHPNNFYRILRNLGMKDRSP